MAEDKKSFFASLPGVLTGLAAVLTAAAGLLYHNRSKTVRRLNPDDKQISEPSRPESQLPEGFKEQPSYDGDCGSPPAGTACIQYRDQYRWLVNDEVAGKHDQAGVWGKHVVMEAVGRHARYRHILGTRYVQEVSN